MCQIFDIWYLTHLTHLVWMLLPSSVMSLASSLPSQYVIMSTTMLTIVSSTWAGPIRFQPETEIWPINLVPWLCFILTTPNHIFITFFFISIYPKKLSIVYHIKITSLYLFAFIWNGYWFDIFFNNHYWFDIFPFLESLLAHNNENIQKAY